MSKVRDEAILRLRNRVARLGRLLELEAPDPILISECLLIAEAAEILAPDAWHARAARAAAERHKRLLHLCEREGCEEAVAWIPSAASPTCPGPFHATHCLAHALEDEAEASEVLDEVTS